MMSDLANKALWLAVQPFSLVALVGLVVLFVLRPRIPRRPDRPATPGAPSGRVTFLFTDIEGSTALWEDAPEHMGPALSRHDEILRSSIEGHGGYVFATGGDGFAAAFAHPRDAVRAALLAQASLGNERWPSGVALRVRMGLHTGEADERAGGFYGAAVNRAARLMRLGHGGQVLCSSVTAGLLDRVHLTDLGEHHLRGLSAPERVFHVCSAQHTASLALNG